MSESAQSTLVLGPALADLEDDWDENDEGEYEDEDEDDDIDAEAEEMARKLNEQIWEDLQKAGAEANPPSDSTAAATPTACAPLASSPAPPVSSRKEEAVMTTIKVIMALLNHDPVAHTTLASTAVPNTTSNVLDALTQILASGKVTKATALTLSQTLIHLAGSEALFGSLRGREAMLGKRKREEEPVVIPPAPKPQSIYDVVSNAVHVVTHALHTSSSINPALITSIQHPLHHIFLFSVSSASKPNPNPSATPSPTTSALQEISGLIQVLGVLSGIQIGVNTSHGPSATDSTMVYPCMVPSCNKTFIPLANLRNHERQHHPHIQPPSGSFSTPPPSSATGERPHKCTYPHCSASFLRNSDLKRHIKVAHERKSFQCGGCGKTFSRRDAIKRHRDNSEAKAQKRPATLVGPPCFESKIIELEAADGSNVDPNGPDAKRVKTEGGEGEGGEDDDDDDEEEEEEGEISESMISSAQTAVMQLHPLLRAVVAKASGASLPLITGATPDSSGPSSSQTSSPVPTAIQPAPTSTSTSNLASGASLPTQGMQVRHIVEHFPSASVTTLTPTPTPTVSTTSKTTSTCSMTSATPTEKPTLILYPLSRPTPQASSATPPSVKPRAQPQTLTLAPVASNISRPNPLPTSLSVPAPPPAPSSSSTGLPFLTLFPPTSHSTPAPTQTPTQHSNQSETQTQAQARPGPGPEKSGSHSQGGKVENVARAGAAGAGAGDKRVDAKVKPSAAGADADGDSDADGEADMDMEIVASAG